MMQQKLAIVLVLLACLLVALSHQYDCSSHLTLRTLDGSCNNLFDAKLGSAGRFYRRGHEGAEYNPDGTPITNRPIERVVSNKIARANPSLRDSIRHSLFSTQFGQFVNHDLENNRFTNPESSDYPEKLVVPDKDDSFCWIMADPRHGNFTFINACLPPLNMISVSSTKTSAKIVVDGVPMVFNDANSWLDLSTVYSIDATQSLALRTGSGGRLLTKDYTGVTTSPLNTFGFTQFGFGPTPPYSCIDCPPSFGQTQGAVPVNPLLNPNLFPKLSPEKVFVSGDVRVGENGALTMFHTLFIRNHNRHAARLQAKNPSWDDEKIFQQARRRNIAEYQAIVMYQYFPSEFGDYFHDKLGHYEGYNPFIDPEINIAFSSAAFRYGHSSFHNYVPRDSCGNPTMFNQPAGNTLLAFGGQTGGPITPLDVIGEIGTFENVIRALIYEVAAPMDIGIDDALRDLPFTFPIAGGTDIFALDLYRARNNGIPNYVKLQKIYGRQSDRIYGTQGCPESLESSSNSNNPDPLACFTRLVRNNDTLAQNLKDLYGKVNRIDPLVGLLLEQHVPGTSFGYTLGSIIVDTYRRVRDGDRFWFENRMQSNPWSHDKIQRIRRTTIGSLLRANFVFPSPQQVPDNPFMSPQNYPSRLASSCSA